ncbi:MAG: SGNH/GDSL hydrolase family protein [Thermoanaerobaculia bacterium]
MTNPPSSSAPRVGRRAHFVWAAIFLLLISATLEGLARWVVRSESLLARISSPFDEASWRLRWVNRHRGGEAPYAFSFDVHHPVRGWAVAPRVRNLEVFGGKRLNTDSNGLRGAREVAFEKTPGTLRIAIFGDSFTFGEDVSDDETFAHQLELLLPGTEVLNFGVHGYGHDQELLYLREALPLYHPDVVLIGHVTDDSMRNMLAFRGFAKPWFRLAGGSLELHATPVPTPADFLAAEVWGSRFLDLLKMARERLLWRWGDRIGETDRLTDTILSAIFREARAAGARPGIALLPVWGELGVASPAPLPGEQFVAAIAAREGIPCLALRPLFVERARLGTEFERREHWRPLEHRLAAAGIADFLRREGLVP